MQSGQQENDAFLYMTAQTETFKTEKEIDTESGEM
jgi:hypothetical protein